MKHAAYLDTQRLTSHLPRVFSPFQNGEYVCVNQFSLPTTWVLGKTEINQWGQIPQWGLETAFHHLVLVLQKKQSGEDFVLSFAFVVLPTYDGDT